MLRQEVFPPRFELNVGKFNFVGTTLHHSRSNWNGHPLNSQKVKEVPFSILRASHVARLLKRPAAKVVPALTHGSAYEALQPVGWGLGNQQSLLERSGDKGQSKRTGEVLRG